MATDTFYKERNNWMCWIESRIYKKTNMIKKLDGKRFPMFPKILQTQQITKLSNFSRESGDFLHEGAKK